MNPIQPRAPMTMWDFFALLFNFFISSGIVASIVGSLLVISITLIFIFRKKIFQLLKPKKKTIVRKKISDQTNYPIIKNFEMQFFDFTFSISELIYRKFINIVLDEFRNIFDLLSIEMDKTFQEFNDLKLDEKLKLCTEDRDEDNIQACIVANKRIAAKSKAYFQQYIANTKIKVLEKTEQLITEDCFWNKSYAELEAYIQTKVAILIQFLADEEKANVYSDDVIYKDVIERRGIKRIFEISFSDGFRNAYKKANDFIVATKDKLNVFESKFKEDFGDSFLTDWGIREKIIDKIGK